MSEDDGALFPTEAARPTRPGQVAATFDRLVAAGREAGTLTGVDDALIEGVRIGAEVLDTARRMGGAKGGYLWVQAMAPYQRGLHALRLPVELSAVNQGAPEPAAADDPAAWFRDTFGTAE